MSRILSPLYVSKMVGRYETVYMHKSGACGEEEQCEEEDHRPHLHTRHQGQSVWESDGSHDKVADAVGVLVICRKPTSPKTAKRTQSRRVKCDSGKHGILDRYIYIFAHCKKYGVCRRKTSPSFE